jgi:hypothetical protein
MISDWISFLVYSNLFDIKDFIVVVVINIKQINYQRGMNLIYC